HLRARRSRHRQRAQLAGAYVLDRGRKTAEIDLHLSAEHVGKCRALSPVGHVDHLDASHHPEQLASQVRARAMTGRRHRHLAGMSSGTVLGATDGLATITNGARMANAIGAKSRRKSYLRL